jgi:hypothetical protein
MILRILKICQEILKKFNGMVCWIRMADTLNASFKKNMRKLFSKSGWCTGLILLLSIVLVKALFLISASHNWSNLTFLLFILLLGLIMMGLIFGLKANISPSSRTIWLALVLGYISFLIWTFYKFSTNVD